MNAPLFSHDLNTPNRRAQRSVTPRSDKVALPNVFIPRAVGKPLLTTRESEIVQLIGEGHANKEVAARLGITEGTVKVYLSSRIFPKLQLTSRLQVALWARQPRDPHQDPMEAPGDIPMNLCTGSGVLPSSGGVSSTS